MKLSLTLACGFYDRTLDLQNGSITPEGIDLNFIELSPAELFRRQARHAEFDVAEFSLCTYSILRSRGDERMVAIPVFPSRLFRHKDIYVNVSAGIGRPQDLIGKRVGASEYQQTAATWIRGILQHEYGVAPGQLEWYFGGTNAPAPFNPRVPVDLPTNVRTVTITGGQFLDQMLQDGEIDAFVGAAPPQSFGRSPMVGRLFPSYQEVEADYYRRTGIFPIMHTVVIKREVYERAPWVAMSLYRAFERAKAAANRRLWQSTLFFATPWFTRHLEEVEALLGRDPFSYGLEQNRKVVDTLLQYGHEQGLTARRVTVDELFVPETHGGPDL